MILLLVAVVWLFLSICVACLWVRGIFRCAPRQ